jgi:Tol biopolymer transport system component
VPVRDKHSEDRSRRRLVWAVAAALLLVLLPLGGGASAATSVGANGDIVFVQGGNVVSTGLSTILTGAVDPSWSPDGTKLAVSISSGGSIKTCTATSCAGSLSAALDTGTEPVWSPDGTKIAYVKSNQIWTVASGGGTPLQITTSGTNADPSWSPTGLQLVFTQNGAIATVSSSGGTPVSVTTNGVSGSTQPAWSPDGTTIAFQSGVNVYVVPAGGGTASLVAPGSAPSWSPDGDSIVYADSAGAIQVTQGSGASWAIPSPRVAGPGDATPDWQSVAPLASNTPPSIFGTAQAGLLLTTDNGTWTGADPTRFPFTYQWKRCDSGGANCNTVVGTSSSYSPVSADVGLRLILVVTGKNAAGSTASLPSNPTAVVTAAGAITPPLNTVAPVVSLPTGETAPELGDLLFASAGTWTGSFPMTFAYSWTTCPAADPLDGPCVAIPGATLSFFTVPASLYGFRIRVRVTATNSAAAVAQSSAASEIVTATAPSLSVTPPVQGQNVVDQTLSVGTGTWFGSTPLTYTYQWKRCNPVGDLASCTPISLATKSTYVPTTADIGFSLRVYITATNPAGSSTGFTNHTFPVVDKQHFKPVSVDQPAITGTLQIGRQLTADAGSFNGDAPITTTLQWQRCDATGAGCHAIANATKVVYFPTVNDLGSTIRFVVTATNAYGTTVAVSDATEPVLGVPPHRRGRRIVGTNGPDYLTGGGYDDVILGEGGNDTIFGGAGDDRLYGGPGNDVITGGPGEDKIYGGPGSDTIYADDGERDFIDCGPGRDRAVVDSVDVVKNCEVVTIVGGSSGGSSGGSPGSPGSP